LGGLSKKAFLLQGLTNEANQPALVINSGNMLVKKGITPAQFDAAAITADTVIQATRAMGGKTMGVGTLDLALGIPILERFHQPPDFALLSANLVAPESNKPIFSPVSWASAGELQIAIIGLTDHHDVAANKAFTVRPWKESLEPTLESVQSKADFIILLSNYSLAENQSIARSFDQIDCILQAGHVIGNMTPIIIKNTLISQTDIRGKYVGVLDIEWNGHGRWQDAATARATAKADSSTYSNRYIGLKTSMRDDPATEDLIKQAQLRMQGLPKEAN